MHLENFKAAEWEKFQNSINKCPVLKALPGSLHFARTLLYSVAQPLILVFGALYFGIAYVVYKYRLLFGAFSHIFLYLTLTYVLSLLQALRVSWTSLAHHILAPYMGRRYLPHLHDRQLHSYPFIHLVVPRRTPNHRHCRVGKENTCHPSVQCGGSLSFLSELFDHELIVEQRNHK